MSGRARIIVCVNRRVILVAILAWTLIALYFATQAYFNPAFMSRPPWEDVLASIALTAIQLFIAEAILWNFSSAFFRKDVLVPALILQPLVENAIHHGISKRTDGGSIVIRARREERWLHLLVRDDGDGAGTVRERVGPGNTRARLQALYGDQHRLDYGAKDKGFAVEIAIPCSAS